MTRIVLAFAALLFLASTAQAASFDCAKAGTPFEKAICEHPDLSHEDDVLAQAYATALGGLSKPSADQLKATQHDWLDFAQRVCGDDAAPISTPYTDDQAQCLTTEFRNRVGALEASRMQGGHRFYPWARYRVEVDPDATTDSYNKLATKEFSTVKIDGTDAVATAFNALTEQMRIDDNETMGEDATLFEGKSDRLAAGDTSADIDNHTTVASVTSNRITLETEDYWYGHGAAHGNYSSSFTHFLVDAKRALVGSDVFGPADWEKTFGPLVVERIKAKLGDDYQGDTDDAVAALAIDPSRWDFSDDGISVRFQPYEVAAYALGSPTVTIAWADLNDLVAQDAETRLLY